MRSDPKLSRVPKTIHLPGEVFGELGRVNHEQGFIVGVGSSWGPVEGSSDHCFVVDHSELVMQLVAPGEAWGSDSLYLQWF